MKTSNIEVELIDSCGSDLSVVNAARVSFDKESTWSAEAMENLRFELSVKDAKLINYLAKNKHISPFNHCFLSFRVKAPLFVARQLVKHKFLPWNEVSRRYVSDEPEYCGLTFRLAAESVKQGSGENLSDEQQRAAEEIFWKAIEIADQAYKDLLAIGVCPEQARAVLPVDQMTTWIWSGTLGAFADMLKLRLDPHAQQESRVVAEQIKTLIEPQFPVSLKALLEN